MELRSKFPKAGLTELASAEPKAWVKEGFKIATRIAHQNGALRGTPKREGARIAAKSLMPFRSSPVIQRRRGTASDKAGKL